MTMGNFFEKLKKGMGDEINPEETEESSSVLASAPIGKAINEEEVTVKKTKERKPKKSKRIEAEEEKMTEEKEKMKIKTKEEKEDEPEEKKQEEKEKTFEPKGELAVDIYQTEKDFVIQSAIAGVKPEDIDISIEDDVINIKGIREKPNEEKADYFSQECFWGPFSKEIILPVEVDSGRAESAMKDGILTIKMPKINRERKRKITVFRDK
jgi:HSP20 family molecular chaperone IbpA